MSELNESDFQEYLKDIAYLVNTLKELFESTDAKYYLDEHNDLLYVELEGLEEYSKDEIAEMAEPLFEVMDLDFEEIILLPLRS